MPNYAQTELRSAPLWQDFGATYATKLFGQEVLDQLPRWSRGSKRGALKATLNWIKVTKGGWSREFGCVVAPGTCRAWITSPYAAPENCSVQALFLGRQQSVCASAYYLGPEGRARHQAELAAHEAQLEAQREEERQQARTVLEEMRAMEPTSPQQAVLIQAVIDRYQRQLSQLEQGSPAPSASPTA